MLNALNNCREKNARWYYLSALANDGLGNQVTMITCIEDQPTKRLMVQAVQK